MQGSDSPKPVPTQTSKAAKKAVKDVLDTVLGTLDESKAEDIITIDIKGKSAIGDYMVVASGRSHRHVGAIADQLVRTLKKENRIRPKIEGQQNSDWVLIDTGDIIIHLFRPEVRDFYGLEKMWQMPEAQEIN